MKRYLMLWLFFIHGCASAPTQFYALESVSGSVALKSEAQKKIVGIAQMSLPSALERKQIVTRDKTGQRFLDEQHQWAALLKQNMTEVIAKNLANRQVAFWFKAYPWSNLGAVDYRLVLDVTRLDIVLGEAIDVSVDWAILDEKQHRVLRHDSVDLSHALADRQYATAVAALNQVLGQLSDQLAPVFALF
jgi:uncharacterized lipoprotein YmbA